MRVALPLIFALAGAASVAQAGEDRYGPARARPMQVASAGQGGAAYQGRMLTWSSRAFTPQVPEAPQVVAPAPTPAPRAEPRPQPQAAVTVPAPTAPRRPVQAEVPSALPDSLYSPAPAPQRLAQGPAPATPPAEGSQVRLYSVHRQYGMAPDAIPAPPANASNYVLIGVPNDGDKPSEPDEKPF